METAASLLNKTSGGCASVDSDGVSPPWTLVIDIPTSRAAAALLAGEFDLVCSISGVVFVEDAREEEEDDDADEDDTVFDPTTNGALPHNRAAAFTISLGVLLGVDTAASALSS